MSAFKSVEESRAYHREWRKKNPDKVVASRNKARTGENRERYLAERRNWQEQNRDKTRAYNRVARFKTNGWSDEHITIARELQQDRCSICQIELTFEPVRSDNKACVDHDHVPLEDGSFMRRELLCDLCNRSIGLMKEDPVRLRRAAAYIEKWMAIKALPNVEK